MKRLILLRHGEATTIDDDAVLTPLGIAEIEKAAKKLKQLSPQILLSSPLPRATESAEIVSRYTHLQVELVHSLSTGDILQNIYSKDRSPLLLVGHAPTLIELVKKLTIDSYSLYGISKGAFVVIDFPSDTWESGIFNLADSFFF